jgi:hypothetical protein
MPRVGIPDIISVFISIVVTICVAGAKNPYEKGSDEYQALKLCRISLVLIAWSFDFGLIGFAFAFAALILAVVGIIKGRALYGTMLIIASVVVPILGMFWTISSIFNLK